VTGAPDRTQEGVMPDAPKTPAAPAPCGACGAPPKEPEATEAAEPLTHCEWCGAEYPVPAGK